MEIKMFVLIGLIAFAGAAAMYYSQKDARTAAIYTFGAVTGFLFYLRILIPVTQ